MRRAGVEGQGVETPVNLADVVRLAAGVEDRNQCASHFGMGISPMYHGRNSYSDDLPGGIAAFPVGPRK